MKWNEFLIIEVVVLVVGLIIGATLRDAYNTGTYKHIGTEIEMTERFNGFEDKKDCVDKCMKVLEDNGCTLLESETMTIGDKRFVKVIGRKYIELKKED